MWVVLAGVTAAVTVHAFLNGWPPDTRTAQEPATLSPQERAMTVPTELYRAAGEGFSIMRPATAEVWTGDYGQLLPRTGRAHVGIALNPTLFAGTSLKEAVVFVGSSNEKNTYATCLRESDDNKETRIGKTLLGSLYVDTFHTTGIADSDVYDLTVHRAAVGDTCYEIVQVLHSAGALDAASKRRFTEVLSQIAQTFSPLRDVR